MSSKKMSLRDRLPVLAWGPTEDRSLTLKTYILAPYLNIVHLQEVKKSHTEAAGNPAPCHDSLFHV